MTEWEGLEFAGRLGVSSTGTVWLARQQSVGRWVAVKELGAELAGDAAVRARLREEARVLDRLDHPNGVAVHSYVESGSGAAIPLTRWTAAVAMLPCWSQQGMSLPWYLEEVTGGQECPL